MNYTLLIIHQWRMKPSSYIYLPIHLLIEILLRKSLIINDKIDKLKYHIGVCN